jgi:hypothetical protein
MKMMNRRIEKVPFACLAIIAALTMITLWPAPSPSYAKGRCNKTFLMKGYGKEEPLVFKKVFNEMSQATKDYNESVDKKNYGPYKNYVPTSVGPTQKQNCAGHVMDKLYNIGLYTLDVDQVVRILPQFATKIPRFKNVKPGDIFLYRDKGGNPKHVAVVTSVRPPNKKHPNYPEIIFESKDQEESIYRITINAPKDWFSWNDYLVDKYSLPEIYRIDTNQVKLVPKSKGECDDSPPPEASKQRLKLTLPADQHVKAQEEVPFAFSVSGGTKPYTITVSSQGLEWPETIIRDTSEENIKTKLKFMQSGTYSVIVDVEDSGGYGEKQGEKGSVVFYVTDPDRPEIKISKAANAQHVTQGESVTYAYSVTNTGNVQLDTITISDNKCSPVRYTGGDTDNDKIMEPNETWTFECADALNATTENRATVEAYYLPNKKITAETAVKVTVGPCPPPQIAVPYLLYNTEAEAMAGLKNNKLKGNVIRKEYSSFFMKGQVMAQDPYDGECVDPNTVVNLVISDGPEPKKQPPAPTAKLSAELDCGDSFELAPGDTMGKRCGIIVRGWRSNTEDRVEVKLEYSKSSQIEVFPGNTSSPPSLMYTAGVTDDHDRYVFSELFTARENASPGITRVTVTVKQKGAGEVKLPLDIAVLEKGKRPSTYSGIRPPATGATGSGGQFCVWRHHHPHDPPNCFEFAKAACSVSNYEPPRWELEGQDMTWEEAEVLMNRLSRYAGNAYGCNQFPKKPTDEKKKPAEGQPLAEGEPPEVEEQPLQQPKAPEPPPARVLFRFGVHCSPSTINIDEYASCVAGGMYSDDPEKYIDLTGSVKWKNGPLFYGEKAGTFNISASIEDVSDTTQVVVEDDPFDSSFSGFESGTRKKKRRPAMIDPAGGETIAKRGRSSMKQMSAEQIEQQKLIKKQAEERLRRTRQSKETPVSTAVQPKTRTGETPPEPGKTTSEPAKPAESSKPPQKEPCPPITKVKRKCPWSPEGYTVHECAPGMCYDAGPRGSLACKQEKAPANSRRSYTGNVLCNDGYKAEYDPCIPNLVIRCYK